MKNVSKAQTLEEDQVLKKMKLCWFLGCRGQKKSYNIPSTSFANAAKSADLYQTAVDFGHFLIVDFSLS